jgi:hypothetical protein
VRFRLGNIERNVTKYNPSMKGKEKVVPLHAMKANRCSKATVPLILNLSTT